MAKIISVELVDDISGEPGATTTRFKLDGVDYEIDLADDQHLRAKMAPWIAKARTLPGRGATSNGGLRPDMHRIRKWARDNNLDVPSRGRMPAAIITAYDKRHLPAQQ